MEHDAYSLCSQAVVAAEPTVLQHLYTVQTNKQVIMVG